MRIQTSLLTISLLAIGACAHVDPNADYPKVMPFAETEAVGSAGDAADDPAIWINPEDASASRVLGTDKKAGLYVYDLSGKSLQFLPSGLLNNVDLRQSVSFSGSGNVDLAAATNRSINGVTLFEIASDGRVREAGSFPVPTTEPYGLCVGNDEEGFRVFVTYKTGEVEIHRVSATAISYKASLANTLKFSSQLEGCSYDEAQNVLFLGEEAVGLWRVDLDGDQELSRYLIDQTGSQTGLVSDVEGVDIWRGRAYTGYVVTSAQSGDRYVVYERAAPNRWVGTFAIDPSADEMIDGVSHTDGLAITSSTLNAATPSGLLVVQDDSNGDEGLTHNFKFVSWESVEKAFTRQINPE